MPPVIIMNNFTGVLGGLSLALWTVSAVGSALHEAARIGDIETVGLLLDQGAELDAKNEDGVTPVHAAAQGDHSEVVALLLDRGADVDTRTLKRLTSLHIAGKEGAVEVVALLLNRGADTEAKDFFDERTPLSNAVWHRHPEIVALLLDAGSDVGARDAMDLTPLHATVWAGTGDILSLLLEKGADINAKTKVFEGGTALHLALPCRQKKIWTMGFTSSNFGV